MELAATISERQQGRGVIQDINSGKIISPDAPPGNRESRLKVLSSRDAKLLLGYIVRCIRNDGEFGDSYEPTKVEAVQDVMENHNNEKLALELQPAERGMRKQVVEVDMVLWTVGSKSLLPQLELDDQTYLHLNGRGQAETDETLRVKSHPRIFALGDSSAVWNRKGKLLPDTAQVALQQADFAGWNIWAAINTLLFCH